MLFQHQLLALDDLAIDAGKPNPRTVAFAFEMQGAAHAEIDIANGHRGAVGETPPLLERFRLSAGPPDVLTWRIEHANDRQLIFQLSSHRCSSMRISFLLQ